MPRKRNGWGNPDSLRFPPLGTPGPKNIYGTSVHRTVIEHYNLNSDWKAWRKGLDLYAHGKYLESDFTLQFQQYRKKTDETNVFLKYLEFPAGNTEADTGQHIVAIKFTGVESEASTFFTTSTTGVFDYRFGLTNVVNVKNSPDDYDSIDDYRKQRASGEIPIVLNEYDDTNFQAIRRCRPGSRLTNGFYSGNLIDLEDEYGKPLRFYAKTYENIRLKGEDIKTRELEEKINTTTYKYKLRRDAFLKLAGDIQASEALTWVDEKKVLDNLVGKILITDQYWNDFNVNSWDPNIYDKTNPEEERFGKIFTLDFNWKTNQHFKIIDITEFPNTIFNSDDFQVLFDSTVLRPESEDTVKTLNALAIATEEPEALPDDKSQLLEISSTYVIINDEYSRYFGRTPENDEIWDLFSKSTTASLTIEPAKILEVIDNRNDEGFVNAEESHFITLILKPSKQNFEVFRGYDRTSNNTTQVIGLFDANSFSLRSWDQEEELFSSDYSKKFFSVSLESYYFQQLNSDNNGGKLQIAINPWNEIHKDMWTEADGSLTSINYDIEFACSCPAYAHNRTKAPESRNLKGGKANRQEKYPLPGVRSDVLTTDQDEESEAGNAITWSTPKYRTSFKNCKHTIAAMFIFGIDVFEPNETPTQENRNRFMRELEEARNKKGYIDIDPTSFRRGNISKFDIALSTFNSLKIPTINPEGTLTRGQNWLDPTSATLLTQINPPLPNIEPFNGADEWDLSVRGDLSYQSTLDASQTLSNYFSSHTFTVAQTLTVDVECYGAGGATGLPIDDIYYPMNAAVESTHSSQNEESYYITNSTFALIDDEASENDFFYDSAATPQEINRYFSYGGIAKGTIELTRGVLYQMEIGVAGGGPTKTRGGHSVTIKTYGTDGSDGIVLLQAGGGGSASVRVVGNTETWLSPGGHGGFGNSPEGTNGVYGFRQHTNFIQYGEGGRSDSNEYLNDKNETSDVINTTPIQGATAGEYQGGWGGSGYFNGLGGQANNSTDNTNLNGASGGGGGSSYYNPELVLNGNYQGTPISPNTNGRIIFKAVNT